jgi:hypothetical protein
MGEKEVELLLWDEGFLADRRVWDACEALELQVRDHNPVCATHVLYCSTQPTSCNLNLGFST